MQAIEIENTLNLSPLPASAQQELIDFYEFLLEKYAKSKPKTIQKKSIAPRLVKEFQPLNRESLYDR
jgi:hypothetical protein